MTTVAGVLLIAISLQPHILLSEAIATPRHQTDLNCNIEHVSCNCYYIYIPVCGTDGNTYSNPCVLNCISRENVAKGLAPIRVYRAGQCPKEQCMCPKTRDPVCGTDNRTYTNDCYLDCENKRRAKMNLTEIDIANCGPCEDVSCRCPDVIVPVCGTDGKTYKNICLQQCSSRRNQAEGKPAIELQSTGACPVENCTCSSESKQICGSDQTTYNNTCLFDCQNRRLDQLGQAPITVQYDGKCQDCICTDQYNPVCGADNRTYSNHCALDCENRRRRELYLPQLNSTLGECPCSCSKTYEPYCASNNVSYANKCLLDCKNGLRGIQNLEPLTILNKGMCACSCGSSYEPLCGSDGKTYYSKCTLDCENRKRKLQELELLSIASRGGECPCNCPNTYQPICGRDNRTYGNECWLSCINDTRASFKQAPIKIAHSEECECRCPECSAEKRPVCGTDGRTYQNDCWLGCRNGCNKYTGQPYISIQSYGACEGGSHVEKSY